MTHRHDPPTAPEATGLGRTYRRGWALRDVSLRLPAGRIRALAGPNGSGKSTLLSLAADLLAPATGTLRVFGAGPRGAHGTTPAEIAGHTVAEPRATGRQLTALIRPRGAPAEDGWIVREPTLEEVLLGCPRAPDAPPLLTVGARPPAPEAGA
ncbi:ATP-binding cassette domain-containing protein [Streptomyces sparsogenes]|uniref:ATP-binding cassette domain-containing protein n=1 Tax=Streptomyces sparsogenes TaxID=67365 RepID=UPI0033F91023